MTIEFRKGKWCTISCHHDPGKVIACFPTKSEAMSQHAAIMSEKYSKIEIDIMKLSKTFKVLEG